MISLKVLSTAAAMALVLPMLAPGASFAQNQHAGRPNVARGGGAGVHPGGGFRPGGGGYHSGYAGGYRRGGGGGGGFIPGAVAGAVIGGAIASGGYGYYGGPGYYAPGYYDDQYYDDGAVAVAPGGGDDAVAYCMQTYRSYDPQSGTYLGVDGYRHPCP
jgi:BA14K-like protein